ncbi:MAG: hypothetical protein ACI4BC_05145 [Muribaculaceae bacterium]
MTIQQVIESYGDSRATEASNTARENAVKDYENRYGLKDGVKTTNTTAGGEQPTGSSATNHNPGGEEVPAWAQTLMADIAELKTSKTTDTRKQQLNAVISKLPENLRKPYERLPLEKYSEEEFNSMMGEITTEVEGIANDTAAKGAVFGKPSASTGSTTSTELTEAQKAAISHREGVPAADSQPF